ncbi:MAG: YccF domain-containing protein, partial [Aeriscardovia aeriphila]|nr:YccF domain-containing protein [Aeriscardovia aeriphila]
GWYMALGYLILGLAWCCTIVGIPIGLQVMKMAKLAFWPFGSQILTY